MKHECHFLRLYITLKNTFFIANKKEFELWSDKKIANRGWVLKRHFTLEFIISLKIVFKFELMGILGIPLNFLKSFFYNRARYIQIKSFLAKLVNMTFCTTVNSSLMPMTRHWFIRVILEKKLIRKFHYKVYQILQSTKERCNMG